jgi:hypothetical protein
VPDPKSLPKDYVPVAVTNSVETDERGYIYIVDRANTGLHILKLTGEAAKIAQGADE